MKLTLTNLHPSLRPPRNSWRRLILQMAGLIRDSGERFSGELPGELSVAWLDDPGMAAANWRHLRHRGPTDILTFDYGGGRAEILISLDTAREHARRYRQTLGRELTLYLAHGILHLAGVGDKTPSQRRRMRREEKWLIQHLKPRG